MEDIWMTPVKWLFDTRKELQSTIWEPLLYMIGKQ